MKNHLHIIGPHGGVKSVFLNLTRGDAIRRWLDNGNSDVDDFEVERIDFDDEFEASKVWSI